MSLTKAALIVGAGDATGGAIARRFAREGYATCVTRRSLDKLQPLVAQIEADGGRAHAFACDARKEEEVVALVEQIESTIGPIEVLVFNIGANVPESILDETARKYFKVWEMACFSGFLNGREVAKRMVARDMPAALGSSPSCQARPGSACSSPSTGARRWSLAARSQPAASVPACSSQARRIWINSRWAS